MLNLFYVDDITSLKVYEKKIKKIYNNL